MAFFASPAKRYLIQRLSERNNDNKQKMQAGSDMDRMEKEERGHPLQGLPSDFTTEVDEVVEEIRREVETRRRKGSVDVGMPKGEEMKKAVEERLGKKIY